MTTGNTGEFIRVQTALAGRYSLERELGRGGMGIVYLARDVALDRLVALKLLPLQLASDQNLRHRFLNEARTAAKLSHPNIVPIFAVDEIGDLVFFVMAFVDGETLGQRVRDRGPVPPSELARLLREVAWGLAYAHGQGVIHRDVKADNILLERGSGRALVADFGIARLTHTLGATGAGEVLGTAEYMSPEQASGGAMDHRSDIYSLGVVAFYSLAGRLPFEADSAAAMLAKHIAQPAPLVRDVCDGVPSKLGYAVDRCLAKNPDDRFPKAEDLADTVSAVLESRKELAPPVRLFIRRSRDLSQVAAGVGFFQIVLAIEALGFALSGAPVEVTLYSLGAAAAMGLIPVVPAVEQVRAFLKAGYSRAELIPAWKSELEREREERVFEHGRAVTVAERVTRGVWIVSATVTGATVWASTTPRFDESNIAMFLAGSGFALVGGVLHLVRYDRRTDLSGRVMSWFWKSRLGQLMFRVGGVALKKSAITAPATHRPTELAIGMAVDALFEALPKASRQQLADLPKVVRGLETDAMNIRRRVDELNDAGTLDPDLLAARDDARARMADAVTALEGIRLNLLRLTAGAGSIGSLTADLSVARDVSDEVRRLLEGQHEIEQHLLKKDQ